MDSLNNRVCPKYKDWLHTTGLEASLSSELAYNILLESFGDGSNRHSLLRTRDDLLETLHTHYWRYALRWRYTPLKLDLLQLAVICRNENAMERLLRLDYNATSDGSASLVNHPFHLACAYGDVHLLSWVQTESGRASGLDEKYGVITVSPGTYPTLLCPAVLLPRGQSLRGDPEELAIKAGNTKTLRMLFQWKMCDMMKSIELEASILTNPGLPLDRVLSTGWKHLTTSAVKRVWRVTSMVCNADTSFAEAARLAFNGYAWTVDACHLFSQLLRRANPDLSNACCIVSLPVPWLRSVTEICTLARYLTPAQFRDIIVVLKRHLETPQPAPDESTGLVVASPCGHEYGPSVTSTVRTFLEECQREQRDRSPQQEAWLSDLDDVRGDVRQLPKLGMAGPLRSLFLVPFQSVHDQLSGREEMGSLTPLGVSPWHRVPF